MSSSLPPSSGLPGPEPFESVELIQVQVPEPLRSSLSSPLPAVCSLSFSDLSASLDISSQTAASGRSAAEPKKILRSLTAKFFPGQICAILGTSGGGKSTLLNILSGRSRPQKLSVSGEIRLFPDSPASASSQEFLMANIAFVPQFDLHWNSLTPMESLLFSIELRFPGRFSDDEKILKAEKIIRSVGLWAARDTKIGEVEKEQGGLSGGEKRRLSMALALLSDSPIFLLDEFVTGLDAQNSLRLMKLVKQIAVDHGKTFLLTIHQPISELFTIFDSILILERGSIIFHGPRDFFLPHFERLGYKCPQNSNPLDFLFLSVINSTEREESPEQRQKRLSGFIEAWKPQNENSQPLQKADERLVSIGCSPAASPSSFPLFSRFQTLFRRNFLLQYRNPDILIGRFVQQAFSFLFLGVMFVPLGDSLQNRLGALFYIANNGLLAALFSTQALYYNEKPLYLRESDSGLYSRSDYYWARILAELASRFIFPVAPFWSIIGYLIIGFQLEAEKLFLFAFNVFALDIAGAAIGFSLSAFISSSQLFLALTPIIILPLALFTGYFLHLPSLHWALRWISYVSPTRYGFQALVVNEFRGLSACSSESLFSPSSSSECLAPSDVIEYLGFNENQAVYGEGFIQFGFAALFLLIGAVGFNMLKNNRTAGN